MNCSSFYNKIYSDNPKKWSISWRDEFAYKVISRHTTPESVLDIGCGNGHTLAYLHKHWDAEYYGIDFSKQAIEIAKRNAPFAKLSCEKFEDSSATADVVVIMGVLEHFKELEKALLKLRDTGRLIYVECPNCLSYSDMTYEGFRRTSNATAQQEWHLTRETWEGYILEAGFEIVESVVGKTKTTEFVWVLQ